MAAFAEDEASGYPAFATDQAVLEFNDSWWSEDDPFAILLWKELAETGRAYA
jgi:hypothetical protein